MVNIETKSKSFSSMKDLKRALDNMHKFQSLHNHMKESFDGLLEITNTYEGREIEYKILIKTCLIELFGLIEADIFYYYSLDKHPPQDGTIRFFDKFKLTFDQIALTWDKQQLVDEYFRTQSQLIRKLRKIRNHQVHPKLVNHLFNPTKKHLKEITACFNRYSELVSGIMNNFFISTTIPFN